MKQTTILPFYTTTNPKKSPLPVSTKTSLKVASIRTPCLTSIYSFDDLSPISKAQTTEQQGTEEVLVTPAKPANKNTKRRPREEFNGITKSIHKKLKNEAENAESKQEMVKIVLSTPPKDQNTQKKISMNLIHMCSQDTADKSFLSSSHEQDASDLSFTEQDQKNSGFGSLLSLSPRFRDTDNFQFPKKSRASVIRRSLACGRQLDMDKADLFGEESCEEKCLLFDQQDNSTVEKEEKVQISQKTMDLISSLRAQYGITRTMSAVKHTKKMVEEEEPKISSKTLGLIKMIKAKSVPAMITEETESEVRESETPSLRERFEELLGNKREFVMPVSYKRLLKVFEGLNKAIVSLEEICFGKVKQCAESEIKREVTVKQVAQIMYVMPEVYIVSWENDDLYIRFAGETSQEKQEEQRVVFKHALLDITRKHHAEFLATLNEQERAKNYEKERCWNSKFNVHECPEIPQADMPAEARLKYPSENATVVRQQKKLTGISEMILARVRATEQELTEAVRNRQGDVDQEELKKIADSLVEYYAKRSVESMFLINAVEYLVEDSTLEQDKIAQYIGSLVELCPEWLSIEAVKEVQVLKMSKRVDMETVYEKIQSN